MDKSIKERILEFIDYKGIEKARFEKEAKLSNGFVDKIGDSMRSTSLDKIRSSYPDLNIQWLLTGEGEMLFSDIVEKKVLDNIISKYSETSIDESNDNSTIDLKQFRKENKLTQKQLAAYLDVTQGFVSQIEKGASQLPERYISKILADNLYKISHNEQKGDLDNNSNNNSSLSTLARAIEILVQNETIKDNNMQELIAQNREQTNNISKLVDLLCSSGIISDAISNEGKRGQFSEDDTDSNTAYNARSANVG